MKTDLYLQGMDSLNDFFEMLYSAMRTVMPEARISTTGAFVWRGYRIDEYEGLSQGNISKGQIPLFLECLFSHAWAVCL